MRMNQILNQEKRADDLMSKLHYTVVNDYNNKIVTKVIILLLYDYFYYFIIHRLHLRRLNNNKNIFFW